MDLVPNTDYLIYLTYGVFKNSSDTLKTSVRGAIKKGYHFSPDALNFKLDPDTKSAETSNSGATKIEWAAATVAATTALLALY